MVVGVGGKAIMHAKKAERLEKNDWLKHSTTNLGKPPDKHNIHRKEYCRCEMAKKMTTKKIRERDVEHILVVDCFDGFRSVIFDDGCLFGCENFSHYIATITSNFKSNSHLNLKQMFNRPKVLSPHGDSPKRSPFTDLKNVSHQDEAKESKGLDNFDWNRKLNLKKTEKVRSTKKKFVVKVAEEKINNENYSPNTRAAYSAFGRKTSPSSSLSSCASRRGECKDSEELTDEDISISYEESSPRYESKDVQHENLLRLAHALSPSQSQESTNPSSLKGPPTDMISPPPTLRNRSSLLVGSPLLNVTKREVELSPQTPDMSVSPSQQVTPPHLNSLGLGDDCSESKSTCASTITSKEDKLVISDDCQNSYEHSYQNQEQYAENYHYESGEYHDQYTEDQSVDFQITNQEYYSDTYHQQVAEEKHSEEVYTSPTSLQALTPVKLKASMTVVVEHVTEEKSVVDSPDSTSSGVTNLSTELLVEQLFSKVRHNRIEEVKKMLDEGTNMKIKDSNGNSLLHICAQNNLKKMANLVLKYGADINAENKKGITALDYCDNYHFEKLGDWFVQNGGDNGHANLRV